MAYRMKRDMKDSLMDSYFSRMSYSQHDHGYKNGFQCIKMNMK